MLLDGKIILRSLYMRDRKKLAVLANNKKIWDNLRDFFPFPYDTRDAERFIICTKKENPQVTFAIEYAGDICGIIGLAQQTDIYKKTAEIGYWLGEPFWNKGIATTAVKLITAYGFNQLNFIRIQAGVFEYNIGSMKVLENNGYIKDGIFKKAMFKNGHIWDEHRFSKVI